jgi:hypothetical protein
MTTQRVTATIAILLAALTPAVATSQPVITLDKPQFVTPAEFTDVSAARLFGDGSMLVADPGAREFVRVTGRGKTLAVVGRHGGGPGEYESAQMLLAMPNGESALVDPPQNRWMVYDSAGAYRRTFVFTPEAGIIRYAEFSDAAGNAYALAYTAPPPAKPEKRVMRWSSAGRIDSLAKLLGPESVGFDLPKGADGRPSGRALVFVPFSTQDVWGVLADGALVVLRGMDARLEWFDRARKSIGSTAMPLLPRVPVSDSARNAEKRAPVRERIPKFQPLTPDSRLFTWPDGRVWIRRSRAADESFTEYLEFTRVQGLTRRLRFPGRSRMVGARGSQAVLARRVDGDLQQLAVFEIPGRTAPARKPAR